MIASVAGLESPINPYTLCEFRAMVPSYYPIEAFGNLWEVCCCTATLVAAALTCLFAPR